jgi:hypothetical protein
MSRSYKDLKDGSWKNATNYGVDDLLVAAELLRQARFWAEEQRQEQQAAQREQNGPGQPRGDAFEESGTKLPPGDQGNGIPF